MLRKEGLKVSKKELKIEDYYGFLNKEQTELIRDYSRLKSANIFNKRMAEMRGNKNLIDDWIYLGFTDLGDRIGKCSLGHPLRYEHYAYNVETKESIIFGVKCVADFFDLTEQQIKLIDKGVKETNTEILKVLKEIGNKKLIDWDIKYIEDLKKVDTENTEENIIKKAYKFIDNDMILPSSLRQDIRRKREIKQLRINKVKQEEARKKREEEVKQIISLFDDKYDYLESRWVNANKHYLENIQNNIKGYVSRLKRGQALYFDRDNEVKRFLGEIEIYTIVAEVIAEIKNIKRGESLKIEDGNNSIIIYNSYYKEEHKKIKLGKLFGDTAVKDIGILMSEDFITSNLESEQVKCDKQIKRGINIKGITLSKFTSKGEGVNRKFGEEIEIIGLVQREGSPYNITLAYVIRNENIVDVIDKRQIIKDVERGIKIRNAEMKTKGKSKYLVGKGKPLMDSCRIITTKKSKLDDTDIMKIKSIF